VSLILIVTVAVVDLARDGACRRCLDWTASGTSTIDFSSILQLLSSVGSITIRPVCLIYRTIMYCCGWCNKSGERGVKSEE